MSKRSRFPYPGDVTLKTVRQILKNSEESVRPIHVIASEIYRLKAQWPQGQISIDANAYLGPMLSIDKITDYYDQDSAQSVVAYFLNNATSWKGEDARRIKKELNAMLKSVQ